MIGITPLEAWIRERVRLDSELTGSAFLEALKVYQLQRVNETIDYARRNTAFYRHHLASLQDLPLSDLSGLARIPFTTSSDFADNPLRFLAVRQDDIAKIVTLRTSGSTGEAKRLFFSEADLELTVDFFHHGMSTLVQPGQRAVVLLPGEKPDSVGDLLLRGLQRMDVQTLVYGPVTDPLHAAEAIASFGAHCLVGIPTQVLAVAHSRAGVAIGKGSIESVLLSTDYVPQTISQTLEEVWGCRVFTHYGMTEMGFGGGVECEALDGYHLREGDLYFEVVDHETGETCSDGETGEVVFTTLTRKGMPLIRYKTGDIARIMPQSCPCGSILRRMGRVRGRWEGAVRLGPDRVLTLSDMDDALFRLQGLLDYRATMSKGGDGRFRLHIDVHGSEVGSPTDSEVLKALGGLDTIRKSVAVSDLEAPTVRFSAEGRWTTTGASKRKIIVKSDPPG
ncbi:MAG: phenylacetate--CoA ligase family protein [Deltaproteobacteria bacterium]|nr:phenylacetate--CoA ligase family protein [Deltaproteobacteria bacterium]